MPDIAARLGVSFAIFRRIELREAESDGIALRIDAIGPVEIVINLPCGFFRARFKTRPWGRYLRP